MPQKIDYAALANEVRGSAPASGGAIDYSAMADEVRTSGGLYDPKRKPASTEDYYQAPKGPEGSAGGRLLSNLGHALNPVTIAKGIWDAAQPDPEHPEDAALGPMGALAPLVRGAVRAQVEQGRKAVEGFKSAKSSNDIYEAVGHSGAALLPLLGPAAAAAGEQGASGDIAGAVGSGLGLIAPMAAGKLLPKSIRVPGLAKAAPDTADALALAERAGVPVDAATATGNRFVKAVQHVSDRSLSGSLVAGAAEKAQQAGLATLGEQLAAKARATATTAAEAGSGAQKGVSEVVSRSRAAADDAYGRLRAIEERALAAAPEGAEAAVPLPADRAGHFTLPKPSAMLDDAQLDSFMKGRGGTSAETGPRPVGSVAPTTTRPAVPMIVDMASVKAAMRPIAERLAAKKGITGALIGKEGDAAARLEALISGPDAVPLSVADGALSDLKRLARTNHPDLRTAGQGVAAKAVSELHQAVGRTAKSAGPEAVTALEEGRLATKAKYAAADVLKRLEGAQRTKSPVSALRGMTQAGDTNVAHLSSVIEQAPQTKPLIARAVLDGLIDHPTAGAAKTWSDWQKIGPETKGLLYAPEHVKELDAFFKLRKMMADNPNPSGTAHTLLNASQAGLIFAEPLSGAAVQIGTAALSKLLHSRAGVRLLTRGMRLPIKNTSAATKWAQEFAVATGATSSTGRQPSPVEALAR